MKEGLLCFREGYKYLWTLLRLAKVVTINEYKMKYGGRMMFVIHIFSVMEFLKLELDNLAIIKYWKVYKGLLVLPSYQLIQSNLYMLGWKGGKEVNNRSHDSIEGGKSGYCAELSWSRSL